MLVLSSQLKMIRGSKYQKLESLLPSQITIDDKNIVENKKCIPLNENFDSTRLYNISACTIMKNEYIAQRILPITPVMFFKPLLQVAIMNNFYNKDRSLKLVPGSLVQLILHWPHESLVLKEVLPPLPPHIFNRFGQFNVLSIVDMNLRKFYHELVYFLPLEILRSWRDGASSDNRPVRRIDISGYYHPTCFDFEGLIPKHLLQLLDAVKSTYNPNCPIVYDKVHKIDLICDASIFVNDKGDMNALDTIVEINSAQGAKFNVIFKRVLISSQPLFPLQNDSIQSLLKLLYKNGTEFIELELYNAEEEIATLFNPKLLGLSIANTRISNLSFIKNMSNLQQLNLSGLRLRDMLEPLSSLPSGLKYLKMEECGLNGEDLKVLKQSHHAKTLLHLDISDNDFAMPIDASELIGFCQVLLAVKVLEIKDCGLHSLTPELLGILFESFADLPKLTLLYLSQNDFSSKLLCTYIKTLHKSVSLRCLCLTVPSDMYVCDDFDVVQTGIQDLQSKIDSEVNFNRKIFVNVIWEKNFSQWYRSIQP